MIFAGNTSRLSPVPVVLGLLLVTQPILASAQAAQPPATSAAAPATLPGISITQKGPETAPVTIVEFSDYLCPYCQKAQGVVDEVLARNQGKVRFVHRDFLLGRPRSMAVARAAQCAADQGKFWDYRRNLLEAPGDWTDEDLLRRTASLGLDRASLQSCLSSDRHDKAILDSSAEGKTLGVQSTPTFFINGRRLRGVRSAEQFQEIIDSELKAGG